MTPTGHTAWPPLIPAHIPRGGHPNPEKAGTEVSNLPAVTIDIAPVSPWYPWTAAIVLIVALAVTIKAEQLHRWSTGVRARRQARRWQNAGNLDRRQVIRPGRWQ